MAESTGIVKRDFTHGKTAYAFQWNRENHERIGNKSGDSASLWAHLTQVLRGELPEQVFSSPLYSRASGLRLCEMKPAAKTALRNRLMKAHAVLADVESDLVQHLREYHRVRNELNYSADHSILREFLYRDPNTIAIEVPVWSERYHISGHIDLLRLVDGQVQVCEYKPGPMTTLKERFLGALPQASAYGEMMTHHLASTLRSALDAPLLPSVRCCVFDTHSSWHFNSDLFVKLEAMGKIEGI
ncbi:MAG: hypothetical protein HXY34_09135 [Candidatus Thorarchaeota archaeon]|nr:hypothetical protein [Candidatus Thorarchaeota archaeon]